MRRRSPRWRCSACTCPVDEGHGYARLMIWLEVVGWLGSALLVWSLLQVRILRLRALNLAGCLVLIGYNGVLHVWPMVGLNVVLAAINVWYLARLQTTRHD